MSVLIENLIRLGVYKAALSWPQIVAIAKMYGIPVAALFLEWAILAKAIRDSHRSGNQLESQELDREFTP